MEYQMEDKNNHCSLGSVENHKTKKQSVDVFSRYLVVRGATFVSLIYGFFLRSLVSRIMVLCWSIQSETQIDSINSAFYISHLYMVCQPFS